MIRKSILLCFLLGFANQLFAQEVTITYQVEDRLLSQIFKDLEDNYDIYFAFSPGQIKGKRATISADQVEINEFLRKLLRPLKLVHDLVEEKYISVKTPESVYLRAQVFDGETGETLPFATARLKDTHLGGVSDEDGRFRLFIDQPLDATLEFSFLGYDPEELDLNTYKSGEELKIVLQPETQTLQRVTIKEYVNSGIASDEKASSFKILPQEMEILPGLSERDVLLSAQIISGINSNDETASGLNIRGSAQNNTFIYWNNIPMYQSAHYFGNISSFIPSSIGEVDIYKNYVPVKYGGSSAGLLTMSSRLELDGESVYEASLNMTHLDVYAKLPFKGQDGAFMIAARRSYNEIWATPTFNSISDKLFEGTFTQDIQLDLNEDFRYNSNINFSDLNLQWLYEPTNRSTWQVSLLRSGSILDYNSEFNFGFERELISQNHDVSNFGANVNWKYRISDDLGSEVSLSYAGFSLSYDLTVEFPDEPFAEPDVLGIENSIDNLELRTTFNWRIKDPLFLNFGYQFNYLDVDNQVVERNNFEDDDEDFFLANGVINSGFAELNWDPSDKLEVIGAGRLNLYGLTGQLVPDGQIRINYQLTDDLVLKSAVGYYNQYLTSVRESNFSFSNTVEQHWILADDDDAVPIIRSTQASIGLLVKKDDWLLDFDLYQKATDGILALNQGFDFTEAGGLEVGDELINGVDLTVMKRWDKFRLWGSYNFQDSEMTFNTNEFGFDPFPSSLNIRHQFQLSGSYTSGPLEFSLGYTFKTGLPTTEVAEEAILVTPTNNGDDNDDDDDDDDDGDEGVEPYYVFDLGPLNARRLANYHRVDASAWYRFGSTKGKKWSGEIGISLINLLNRKNEGAQAFSLEGDLDPDAEEPPRVFPRTRFLLGFTPNISLRFRF